ncbi:MAG: 3-deoxy-D-manno-octulosonic acid transferase [Halocynthiibacter sp.]
MRFETPLSYRAYRTLTGLIPLIARRHLRKRIAKGKEHDSRWIEKLGQATLPRPAGRLIWLHAVGLGEVLALRGLIDALHARDADLNFLVTSGTLASSKVFEKNAPANTVHQFLPLDHPRYIRAFLDHWQPDLSIWSEQEIWPNHVFEIHKQGIPLALINGRLTSDAFESRSRFKRLYQSVYQRFSYVVAQDLQTADRLAKLGALDVKTHPTLKAGCAPLAADAGDLQTLQESTQGRMIWAATSTHPADETMALEAHKRLLDVQPDALLIVAPRNPSEMDTLRAGAAKNGMTLAFRGETHLPSVHTQVFVSDTFGELGLWYRLARRALIGGSFGDIGGHNPWEAAQLDCAILHGPNMANFIPDMKALHAENAALETSDTDGLFAALIDDATLDMPPRARVVADRMGRTVYDLADELTGMLKS